MSVYATLDGGPAGGGTAVPRHGRQANEVALRTDGGWHRSSRCESLACVEVTRHDDGVRVRDARREPVLTYRAAAWDAFCAAVRDDRLAATR